MLFALVAAAALAVGPTQIQSEGPADVVLTDGKIYTVDASHSIAGALAVKDGKIAFVGSAADAKHWIGPATHVETLGGRLVLPLGGYLVRVTQAAGRRRVEPLAAVRFVPLVTGLFA